MNLLVIIFFCGLLAAADEPASHPPTLAAPRKQAGPRETSDPIQQEYEKLIALDEGVLKEVSEMEKEFAAFQDKGAAGSRAVLASKIDRRLDTVKKAYDEFLQKHANHVEALLAYGSFLNEIGEEEAAIVEWEKAREVDPKNPSSWNNLANIYAHIGPIKKGFQYYEKAIELDPNEPVYIQNLAIVTYLFRKDAAEMYRIDEEAVFNKALELYRRAMKLDPTNILLATDYAQSFYGIRPLRADDAVAAWKNALSLAKSAAEREGIYLHLARVELNSGRFSEARNHLDLVKDPGLSDLKQRLEKNLQKKKGEADLADGKPTP